MLNHKEECSPILASHRNAHRPGRLADCEETFVNIFPTDVIPWGRFDLVSQKSGKICCRPGEHMRTIYSASNRPGDWDCSTTRTAVRGRPRCSARLLIPDILLWSVFASRKLRNRSLRQENMPLGPHYSVLVQHVLPPRVTPSTPTVTEDRWYYHSSPGEGCLNHCLLTAFLSPWVT